MVFTKAKNIDTAFKYIRRFTMAVVIVVLIICCFSVYKSFQLVAQMQQKVYILESENNQCL